MRYRKYSTIAVAFVLFAVIMAGNVFAQLLPRLKDERQHRNGKLWAHITNFGQFGSDVQHGAIWPGQTDQQPRYINRGGMMLGGILDADGTRRNPAGSLDTLVSEGPSMWSVVDFREMLPPFADDRSLIKVRSTVPNSEFFDTTAVSGEDFISVYTDIFTAATGLGPAKHQWALGLEVIEKSYQFSVSYAEDLVFFDLEVKNIGNNIIKQFYMGFWADNDMSRRNTPGVSTNGGQRDDASGFMEFNSTGERVNTMWVAEPDGDNGNMPGVVGVRVLRPTAEEGRISANWWMSDSDVGSSSDWGPRSPDVVSGVIDPNDPFGSPEEDEDKYVVMINGSFDPPQFDPATGEFNPDIPAGADPNDNSRFMISFGPLGAETGATWPTPRGGEKATEFSPGEVLLFTYVVIGGEGDPVISNALQTPDPAAFVDLGINAVTAFTMFDNPIPGSDPPRGDGIPDFAGPPAPPSPTITVTAGDRQIVIDWSSADPSSPGYDPNDLSLPLNFKDSFVADDPNTPQDESIDFEGFMVLRAEINILTEYQPIAVFDIADNNIGANTGLQFSYTDHIPNGATFFYAVVSFDRGIPEVGLESLRSSALINATQATAGTPLNVGLENQVWVEPNPYIEQSNFEQTSTSQVQIEHRRVLDFVNLPAECTIKIFTVDGDLVQTLEKNDAATSRLRWDMLTRSIQAITSGIYLYSVRDHDTGEQIVGKFVVIK